MGVTFHRRHKPGGHLDAVKSHIQPFAGFCARIDASGHYYRDFPVSGPSKGFYGLQDTHDLFFIMHPFDILKLFPVKTQMAAGQRPFDHHQIRQVIVLFHPVFHDDICRLHAGDDGRKLCLADFPVLPLYAGGGLRQRHRQSGAGNNQIRAGFRSSLYVILIAFCGHHNIYAHNTAGRQLLSSPDFLFYRTQIGGMGIYLVIRLTIADLCRGDYADTALRGHCAGQPRKADSHAHAPLYHRKPRR